MAEEKLKVILKAEELAEHTLRVTSNCNVYPKKYRFSLVDKMQNKALEIYMYLYMVVCYDPSVLHGLSISLKMCILALEHPPLASQFSRASSIYGFVTVILGFTQKFP